METKTEEVAAAAVEEVANESTPAAEEPTNQEAEEAESGATTPETPATNTLQATLESINASALSAHHDNALRDSNHGNSPRDASPAASDGSVEDVKAATTAKAAKDAGKTRRKEAKGIEHVLKALNSLETTEEKLAALCTKYTELLEEHRVLQNKSKQNQRKLTALTREKDQLQNEQSKTVLAKSKLESLCRELQRHNKLIKDESVARAKEEEEKRKEVTSKFQATINDIQRQMNENYEKNNKLREENVELATKLKNLIEQYEQREQHIEKVFKHKELEQQLIDAKLAQAQVQFSEEHERNLKEKQMLLEQVGHSNTKIELMGQQEVQLRNQVALYTDKYEEFQQTLTKSNDVFQSFKTEMDKMTKKIKKLEKETTMWRSRWENSNKALIEMAEEKTRSDKETLSLNSKIQKLESLCRALQEERKKLSNKVAKATGVTSSVNGSSEADTTKDVTDSDNKAIEPTKTPPNTPDAGSRASPVTVQTESSQSETSAQTNQSASSKHAESVSDQLEAVLQKEESPDQTDKSETMPETSQSENSANSPEQEVVEK